MAPLPESTASILLRLRWAEALLAASQAEDVIAHYASEEATFAARVDKAARQSSG